MLNLLKIKAIILEGIYKNAEYLKNGMMNNENNIKLIEELKELGINPQGIAKVKSNKFEGKTFVLTGTLPTMTRDEASEIIKSHGGKTSSSVSKKTSYVLAGENAGSKLDKAVNLGVIILTEDDFLGMIKE